ncbi:MAG: C40 family peptidase [Pseudomonadota bacterium]
MPRPELISTLRAAADRHLAHTRELVTQSLRFLGIRYKFGGTSPDTGFDCSGFVRYVVGQAVGLVLPRRASDISKVGAKVTTDELQPGDLVFFNTQRRPYSHIGIYVGDQRFIHAPAAGGKVQVVHMGLSYWQSRFDGARRLSLRTGDAAAIERSATAFESSDSDSMVIE